MKKIVLAYSGGLDTSIILRWLQENYKAEVIAYTSDIGQEINKKKIITNAKRLGVKNIIIEDLKNNGAIIIATVVGIDGTLSQNIYAQTTFTPSQIVKDHQFVDMLKIHPNGQIEVEHDKISDIRPNGSDR